MSDIEMIRCPACGAVNRVPLAKIECGGTLDTLEQHGRLLAKLVDQRESRDGSGPPVRRATGSARS